VLSVPVSGRFRATRLVLKPAGAGLSFDCH
jgi:hypothetical protein